MHQIIYTSCRRGRDGASDGQQVYSYDQGFTESKSDEVKGIFGYQLPSLPAGQVMTEELARTMPQAFFYRNLSRGRAVISLNTYLGRDYMGSAGRFGNYLSHAFIGDLEEFSSYPCEYLDGGSLRSAMSFEEVNLAETPPYLPSETPRAGEKITPDAVMELLSDGENMELFQKMLRAVLRFPKEKKRLIICDTPENILLWIAALEYAFPLETARTINFTTYSFDPELAAAQICGVIPEGTKYQPKKYVESGRFYVFDLINGVFSNVPEDETENELMDFFDTWFSIDYDTIRAFHRFLEENTTYRKADDSYAAAYQFYLLCTEGLEAVAKNAIAPIRAFMADHAGAEGQRLAISELVRNETAVNGLAGGDAIQIYSLVTENAGGLDEQSKIGVSDFLISQLMEHLSAEDVTKDMFDELYQKLVGEASRKGIHILEELYREENRKRIQRAISDRILEKWKLEWFLKVAADHVRFEKIPADSLGADAPEGAFYQMLLLEAYKSGIPTGQYYIDHLLESLNDPEAFVRPEEYLLQAALMIDKAMLWGVDGPNESEHLWKSFGLIYIVMPAEKQAWIRRELMEREEYKCISEMYIQLMAQDLSAVSFDEKQNQTREQYKLLSANPAYADNYRKDIAQCYAQTYLDAAPQLSDVQREYVLEVIDHADKLDGFAAELVDALESVLRPLTLDMPGAAVSKAVRVAAKWCMENKECKEFPVKALLLELGNLLNGYQSREDKLGNQLEMIRHKNWNAGRFLGMLDRKETEKYFRWALEPLFCHCYETGIYEKVWYILGFSSDSGKVDPGADAFLRYTTEEHLARAQKESNYSAMIKFISFAVTRTEAEREVVARTLGIRLKGRKLDDFEAKIGIVVKKGGNEWAKMLQTARDTKVGIGDLINGIRGG